MIVRSLKEILNTEVDVHSPDQKWISRRVLTKKDGVGFSLSETFIFAGKVLDLQYKNHFEVCYCIEGRGEISGPNDKGEIKKYPINPGSMYCLNQHERHQLVAETDMRLITVFNPPLIGPEVHDKDGSYPESK